MADVPFLERLAQQAPIPAAAAVALFERLDEPHTDPLVGPMFVVDEEGEASLNPLAQVVLQQFQQNTDLTCFTALIEGLTGIWNAAVRAGVLARLRAAGLPADDFLLRLQAVSPTLGFAAEKGDISRQWLADPFTQDAILVQQCLARLLFAIRAMAEARAVELTTTEG